MNPFLISALVRESSGNSFQKGHHTLVVCELWWFVRGCCKRHQETLKSHCWNCHANIEELTTVLTQIEACLNSRPLTSLPCNDGGVIQTLTPGHFLIGRPLEALPNPDIDTQPLTVLNQWYLCQGVVKHFWKHWSNEYLHILQRSSKWQSPSRNLSIGDIVILCEDNKVPSQWPLARIVQIHHGKDDVNRVVTVRTSFGNRYT